MKTPEELAKDKKGKKVARTGCLSVIIIIVIISIISGIFADSTQDHSQAAYRVSKDYVKSVLDYPEEADFPTYPIKAGIKSEADSTYRVFSEVTLKNAFGVKSKKRYIMIMKYKGGEVLNPRSWEVVDFNF